MSLGRRQFTPLHTSTMPDFTVGSIENISGHEHWVARLFPPTYREDLGPEEMKTVLSNRLTAINPEALRNVFYKVHALLTEQKEVMEGGRLKIPARREPPPVAEGEKLPPSIDDSCIWNDSEISVLRQAYKSIRDENRRLKNNLKFVEQRLGSLDSKYTKLRTENEETTEQLNEARKANSRLQMITKTLKRDLQSFEKESRSMTEEIQTFKLERLDLLDKVKNSRIESDRDRIEMKRMELEVRENGRTLIETAAHLEAKLRVKYQNEVNELTRKIEDLQEELADERKTHAATRRGLDHLRTHFASLPIEKTVKDEINIKSY